MTFPISTTRQAGMPRRGRLMLGAYEYRLCFFSLRHICWVVGSETTRNAQPGRHVAHTAATRRRFRARKQGRACVRIACEHLGGLGCDTTRTARNGQRAQAQSPGRPKPCRWVVVVMMTPRFYLSHPWHDRYLGPKYQDATPRPAPSKSGLSGQAGDALAGSAPPTVSNKLANCGNWGCCWPPGGVDDASSSP